MAQDNALIIDWKGEDKNRIGELLCTIEVDRDGIADFETRLNDALGTIDPSALVAFRELSDAISEIVIAGVHVCLDVYANITPIIEQAQKSMSEFVHNLQVSLEPVFGYMVDWWEGMIDIYETYHDCENAYREHVVKLNWKRPHRKLSWRRLNRQQRRDAIWEYLAKHGPFSL